MIFNDMPIENIEESILYDKSYAESLAEFIGCCDTPITIVLQGEWEQEKHL